MGFLIKPFTKKGIKKSRKAFSLYSRKFKTFLRKITTIRGGAFIYSVTPLTEVGCINWNLYWKILKAGHNCPRAPALPPFPSSSFIARDETFKWNGAFLVMNSNIEKSAKELSHTALYEWKNWLLGMCYILQWTQK